MEKEKAENTITQELARENVTEKVIADLKKNFLPLKINGIEDKEGYKKVHDARIQCRDVRILAEKICKKGREDAIKEQREWLAKEKEVVAQISEVEQHLKKQEDAVDTEIENRKIKAERLLKLPGRKTQMIGIEKWLGPLDDEQIMRFDDSQWDQVILIAKDKKITEFEEKERIKKHQEILQRSVEREKELMAQGAVPYFDGLAKVYRKGKTSVSEQAIRECPEEEWPSIIESFQEARTSRDAYKPGAEKRDVLIPESYHEIKITDEERLFNYASALERVPLPEVTSKVSVEILDTARKLINEAINILRQ